MSPLRPNVLFMICHDLGRYLSCYEREPIATPNLDRLADEGILFTQHFCTAPSCSPSRGSIMTGRYPHSNGLMGLVNLGWELPDSERTLPQYLKDSGYHTVLCGIQHERSDPGSLGYNQFIGNERGPSAQEKSYAVIDFLKQAPPEPFFLSFGIREPHRPFNADKLNEDTPVFLPPYLPDNKIVKQQMAGFGQLVIELDEAIGLIHRALDDAGLSEHTLVVFTTDHGIDMPRAKGTLYDPGIEAALIMRQPKIITAGKCCGELLSNVDILPTILEACRVDRPDALQGRSFWPLVLGNPYRPRDAVFGEKTHHCHYDPMRCIRTATHKYICNFGSLRHLEIPADGEMDCLSAVPELCQARRPITELYDLEKDPLEMQNVAGDPEYAEIESALRTKLRQWMADTQDPFLDGIMPMPKYL